MVIIGYARISTAEQSAELQTAALREAGCDRIFTDRDVNGTRTGRPDLNNILDHLRPGDELVIWKLDRLGRSTKKLLQFIELLDAKGVTFRSLSEDITTTGPNGRRETHPPTQSTRAQACRHRKDDWSQPGDDIPLPEHRKRRAIHTGAGCNTST